MPYKASSPFNTLDREKQKKVSFKMIHLKKGLGPEFSGKMVM